MEEIIDLIKTGKNKLLKEKLKNAPSKANTKTEQGISLVQFAAYCRNREAIDIIRSFINDLDIFEAASVGDRDRLLQLISLEPDIINNHASDGFTALGLASFFGHKELVILLLEKGADPNIPASNPFKVTPLHSACAISNYDIAELLIKNGADVNAKQMQGVTPLHSAAHNGKIDLVKLLIENGADKQLKMDDGQTPLSMAEEKEFTDIIDYLK